MPDDLHGWSMSRLRELAADDSNKAASVAALKELLARSSSPKPDVGSSEARGVSLWAILTDGETFDRARHTLEELVYCVRDGVDPGELLPEARRLAADVGWTPREDRRTAEGGDQEWPEVPEAVQVAAPETPEVEVPPASFTPSPKPGPGVIGWAEDKAFRDSLPDVAAPYSWGEGDY